MVVDRRVAFCARLKAAREGKGVSLDDIAASTKIGRSLLAGLESNDVSRWPQGLYRRSYLRDYLRAIDLPPESFVAEFVRLFPGDGAVPIEAPVVEHVDEGGLSMTLAEDETKWRSGSRKRILAATLDVVTVLIASGAAWWLMRSDVWVSGAIVSVCYYSAGTVLGRTFGTRLLDNKQWRRPEKSGPPANRPERLLARFRRLKALPQREDSTVNEPLSGVPGNAAFFRSLFLR